MEGVKLRKQDHSRAWCQQDDRLQGPGPHNSFQPGALPQRPASLYDNHVANGSSGATNASRYQPGVLKRQRLGTAIAALVCLLGALITAIATWLLLWAPNLPSRDVPVYSGPPLLLAGILGLALLGCCRKDYPGRPFSCCMFSFKVVSVGVAALSTLSALCASAFALLHVVSLWGSACEPAKQLVNVTCTCEPAYKDPNRSWAIWVGTTRHTYPDLSCPEVESLLSVLLTGSGAANLFGGLLAGWYVLLHWRSRYTDVYAQVHTSASPVVISNVTKA